MHADLSSAVRHALRSRPQASARRTVHETADGAPCAACCRALPRETTLIPVTTCTARPQTCAKLRSTEALSLTRRPTAEGQTGRRALTAALRCLARRRRRAGRKSGDYEFYVYSTVLHRGRHKTKVFFRGENFRTIHLERYAPRAPPQAQPLSFSKLSPRKRYCDLRS